MGKIGNLLLNCKQKVEIMDRSGIYKITCGSCDKFYIGQSGRTLHERLKEHQKRTTSALGKHLNEEKHSCDISGIRLLHETRKSKKMDLLEEYEILKHKQKYPEKILNYDTNFSKYRLYSHFLRNEHSLNPET